VSSCCGIFSCSGLEGKTKKKKKIREEVALWTRVMVGGGERATDDQDVVTRDKCPPKDRLYLAPFLNAGSPIHPSIQSGLDVAKNKLRAHYYIYTQQQQQQSFVSRLYISNCC
jgi:hypothetical protein